MQHTRGLYEPRPGNERSHKNLSGQQVTKYKRNTSESPRIEPLFPCDSYQPDRSDNGTDDRDSMHHRDRLFLTPREYRSVTERPAAHPATTGGYRNLRDHECPRENHEHGGDEDGDGGSAGVPEVNVTSGEWGNSADPSVVDGAK